MWKLFETETKSPYKRTIPDSLTYVRDYREFCCKDTTIF